MIVIREPIALTISASSVVSKRAAAAQKPHRTTIGFKLPPIYLKFGLNIYESGAPICSFHFRCSRGSVLPTKIAWGHQSSPFTTGLLAQSIKTKGIRYNNNRDPLHPSTYWAFVKKVCEPILSAEKAFLLSILSPKPGNHFFGWWRYEIVKWARSKIRYCRVCRDTLC